MFESDDEDFERLQTGGKSNLPLFNPAPTKKHPSKQQIRINESISGSQELWQRNNRQKLPGPKDKGPRLTLKDKVLGIKNFIIFLICALTFQLVDYDFLDDMRSGSVQKNTNTEVVAENNNNSAVEVGDTVTREDNYDRVVVPKNDMAEIRQIGNF